MKAIVCVKEVPETPEGVRATEQGYLVAKEDGSFLIDPIGPQHSQPLEPMSFEQALAKQQSLDDDLWRRWGFGPRAGQLADGLDIDLATATAMLEGYQRDCFPIRPALLQPMNELLAALGADSSLTQRY